KTARQIVPKPVLYSSVVALREHVGPLYHLAQAGDHPQLYALQHTLLAPSFTAYLFDQTIDNYNFSDEHTFIDHELGLAKTVLDAQSLYYMDRMRAVLHFSRHDERSLPESLRPFWMLVNYCRLLRRAGASEQAIFDQLYTVADVLTNEQRGALAYAEGGFSGEYYVQNPDCLDDIYGIERYSIEDARYSAVLASLRGQGYFMVGANHYLWSRLNYHIVDDSVDVWFDPSRPDLRTVLEGMPDAYPLLRLFEVIVKGGDDAGDIDLDVDHQTLNWIMAGNQALAHFHTLSGLREHCPGSLTEEIIERMISIEARFRQEQPKSGAQARHLLAADLEYLIELYGQLENELRQALLELPGASEDFRLAIRLLSNVVYGSLVNARYNDAVAEEIGQALDE
ncbi:MAG: hypothetical protein GYB64_00215, partial [Chloroflexi bacterium]|nr:hypothetical protein [Chloroflexota bacterium]